MSLASDQELLSFVPKILEHHGAVVEQKTNHLLALLPEHLSNFLKLPEEVQIGDEGEPLLYGSPLLDRLVNLATRDVPVVYGQLQVPYLKKAGFEQHLLQDISFGKVQSRIIDRAEARTTYMILFCHYLALSDERKEGIVKVAVHESTGSKISDLESRWSEFQPQFFSPENVPPHFPMHLDQTINVALNAAQSTTENELSDFFNSMRRHLCRDVRNTREYYNALKWEMEASLERQNLSEEHQKERKAKILELPQEMARKIDDLKHKYQVQVTLTGCAAVRLLVPVVQIRLEIRYSKLRREVRVIYNPISRRFDSLVCEQCRITTRKVHPFVVDSQIRLICSACSKNSKL